MAIAPEPTGNGRQKQQGTFNTRAGLSGGFVCSPRVLKGYFLKSFEFQSAKRQFIIFGKTIKLPRGKGARIAVGSGLVLGGLVGFLPVVGFWMVPVGLLVLSQDLPMVRRWRRSLAVKFGRKQANADKSEPKSKNRSKNQTNQ